MASLGGLVLKAIILGVILAVIVLVTATASDFVTKVVIPIVMFTVLAISQGLMNALQTVLILLGSILVGVALVVLAMLSATLTLIVVGKIYTWFVERFK